MTFRVVNDLHVEATMDFLTLHNAVDMAFQGESRVRIAKTFLSVVDVQSVNMLPTLYQSFLRVVLAGLLFGLHCVVVDVRKQPRNSATLIQEGFQTMLTEIRVKRHSQGDGQDNAHEQECGDALEAAAALLVHVYDQGRSLDVPRAPTVPFAPQETASDEVAKSDDHGASRHSRAASSRAGVAPAASPPKTSRRPPRASPALPNKLVSFYEANNFVAYCNRHVGCILTQKTVASGPGRSGAAPKRHRTQSLMCRSLDTDVVGLFGCKRKAHESSDSGHLLRDAGC